MQLLQRYYQHQIFSLNESVDEERNEIEPVEADEVPLLEETLRPRENLPPLLLRLPRERQLQPQKGSSSPKPMLWHNRPCMKVRDFPLPLLVLWHKRSREVLQPQLLHLLKQQQPRRQRFPP